MARRLRKMLGTAVIILLILASVAITFTIGWRPIIGPRMRTLTDRRFETTNARLERGRYLVDSVMGCLGCHSPTDIRKPGAPPAASMLGAGARWADAGLPWVVVPNITPDKETGAGNWTDDMLARAIREGVGHDGRLLDPTRMPYEFYRAMSDEDLASIIVYLRSIPAIRNPLPAPKRFDKLVAPFAIPINSPV